MRAIKIIAIICACILGLGAAFFAIRTLSLFAVFSRSASLHQNRVQQAAERMGAYHHEDWRALYADCIDLYKRLKPSNSAIETNEWPAQLVQLQPYYVWIGEDCVWMNWTGGFDDFSLYVYVYRQKGELNGASCAPGVYVVDTRGRLPAHPYDRNADAMSQQDDAANGSQPFSSETNRTSSAPGSRR